MQFLDAFQASQLFWMFINEREDLAIRGGLTNKCILLKKESDKILPFKTIASFTKYVAI